MINKIILNKKHSYYLVKNRFLFKIIKKNKCFLHVVIIQINQLINNH